MTDNENILTDCNRFGRSLKTTSIFCEKTGQGDGLGRGEGEGNILGKGYGFGWANGEGDETGASEC